MRKVGTHRQMMQRPLLLRPKPRLTRATQPKTFPRFSALQMNLQMHRQIYRKIYRRVPNPTRRPQPVMRRAIEPRAVNLLRRNPTLHLRLMPLIPLMHLRYSVCPMRTPHCPRITCPRLSRLRPRKRRASRQFRHPMIPRRMGCTQHRKPLYSVRLHAARNLHRTRFKPIRVGRARVRRARHKLMQSRLVQSKMMPCKDSRRHSAGKAAKDRKRARMQEARHAPPRKTRPLTVRRVEATRPKRHRPRASVCSERLPHRRLNQARAKPATYVAMQAPL